MRLLTEVEGVFVKIAYANDVDVLLTRGDSNRPAARFNRIGQDTLYLSPDEDSARVAIGEYVKPNDPARVLLRYDVQRCALFELRHAKTEDVYALAKQPWRRALAAGETPASWDAADQIRRAGYAGLIDPSRRRLGLWHITLMRWNEPDAPTVRQIGEPVPISVEPNYK